MEHFQTQTHQHEKARSIPADASYIRRFHWWSVYQFANPQNYPKYWDHSKLPQIPESDSEESDSPCSESESVSDSSYESDTNSSETPSEVSDDSSKHSSSSEESSENSS